MQQPLGKVEPKQPSWNKSKVEPKLMSPLMQLLGKVELLAFIENRYQAEDEEEKKEKRDIYTALIECVVTQGHTSTAKAMTIELLPSTMPYADVATMAFHLSLQLQTLERKGYSLLFWQAADILWINQEFYLLANLTQLVPLLRKKPEQLLLTYPQGLPFPIAACAPEVLQMKALPFITHRSCSYYSLALMCLRQVNLSLVALQGTKLFYFLERCLKEDLLERYCYF